MEKENFRILLDLSDLEDRAHKYVWMLISTIDLKYVADFKKAVIKKLALNRDDIKMFINGGLLLEEEKIMILRENDTVQIQYENSLDLVCHSSSYMEIKDNKLLRNTERNETVKHSKKHRTKSKVVASEIVDENKDKDLSKRKRKRCGDEYANEYILTKVEELERCEDEILFQVDNPTSCSDIKESICDGKKKKPQKYCSTPSSKDVITQNEDNNTEKIGTVLGADDATTITLNGSSEERNELEENSDSKPADIAVESFIQGSNCKKRKRKRHRKRRIDPNLISPFISTNMNAMEKLTKESPPIFTPCDNFADIRKHIKYTSPIPDCNNKITEIVDLDTACPDSQAEISPNKTCHSPIAKPSSFPTRKMYMDRANRIANDVYSKILTSPNSIRTLPSAEISSLTTSKTYVDDANEPTPKSKACITPSYSTSLFSTNSMLGNIPNSIPTNAKISTPTNQKSLLQNSWTASPIMRENGNESSPGLSVSKSKEHESLKNSILSYEDLLPLNHLPPVGTCVAFKLLELDENYSPEVSKYKEGVIKSINPKSEELEIELTKVEIKPGRTGKFENLGEEEDPSDVVIRTVVAAWSSLIEPRLIK